MGATLRKNLGSTMPNLERWLMSSGKPRTVGDMQIFVACQIDVVNK